MSKRTRAFGPAAHNRRKSSRKGVPQYFLGGVAVTGASVPLLVHVHQAAEAVWVDDEQLRSESVAVLLPSRAPPLV